MAEISSVAEVAVIDQPPAPAVNPEPAPAPQKMEVVKVEEAPAPVQTEERSTKIEEQQEAKKKQKSKKRSYPFHGMYPPSTEQLKRAAAEASGAPMPISRADISKVIKARFTSAGSILRNLFTFEDCAVTNDLGDVRFGNCVLVSPLGPFAANESIRIIDWLPSVSTVLISKTAKVSDTVALEIAPASIGSQIPLH